MRPLNYLGAGVGALSALTKDDIIFLLSLVIVIINAVIAYLDRKKGSE